MNHNQQFDEHIREQFNNYAPDVHPRIWENIVAGKERRKPVGFWIRIFNNRNRLVLAGMLIAISTAGTWYYINNGFAGATTTTGVKENNIKDETKPGVDKTISTRNTITLNQTGDELVEKQDRTSGVNNTLTGNPIPSSTPGVAKIRIYSPSLPADDGQSLAGDKKRHKQSGTVVNVTTLSPDPADDDLSGQGSLLGRLTFDFEKMSAAKKKKSQQLLSFKSITYLPGCPSLEKNTAGNKRYFEIYGGPDYAFRSMSDTGNSVYLQKRKESEKFKSAFNAGIRYTRVFNNSMSVRGGINYSQINEKFTYTQGNLVQVTYIIDANGDTTGTYLTTGTRYKTTINKYRSIDIPVVIGYEVGNGKLHANINAGIVVNVYSWQKGEVLDRSLNPVNITTGKGSSPYQFKTNAGIGLTGGVSVYYKLNDRIHILAEPYFRYNFAPMNKENITLKQKYHTAGLRLGVRLDLK